MVKVNGWLIVVANGSLIVNDNGWLNSWLIVNDTLSLNVYVMGGCLNSGE